MPVYMPGRGDDGGSVAAICLETGTRASEIEEPEDGDVWVRLSFANSARHEIEAPASIVAGLAVSPYVALTILGAPDEARNSAMHDLSKHFHFNTDLTAYLPNLLDPDNPRKELAPYILGWTARVAFGSL